MEVRTVGRSKAKTVPADVKDEMLKKARKEHSKLVKGMFEFLDANGGWLEFAYRFFPEDPLVTYKFSHGEICEIPMGIVKHLNNTKKKIRTFGANEPAAALENARGLPSSYEVQSRIRFTPIEVL